MYINFQNRPYLVLAGLAAALDKKLEENFEGASRLEPVRAPPPPSRPPLPALDELTLIALSASEVGRRFRARDRRHLSLRKTLRQARSLFYISRRRIRWFWLRFWEAQRNLK
jgi:hypothetical protein